MKTWQVIALALAGSTVLVLGGLWLVLGLTTESRGLARAFILSVVDDPAAARAMMAPDLAANWPLAR